MGLVENHQQARCLDVLGYPISRLGFDPVLFPLYKNMPCCILGELRCFFVVFVLLCLPGCRYHVFHFAHLFPFFSVVSMVIGDVSVD